MRNPSEEFVSGFCRNFGDLSTTNVFLIELLAVSMAIDVVLDLDIPQVIKTHLRSSILSSPLDEFHPCIRGDACHSKE